MDLKDWPYFMLSIFVLGIDDTTEKSQSASSNSTGKTEILWKCFVYIQRKS